MKKVIYLLMLILISLSLLITACSDDDNDGLTGIPEITPENYDWSILFLDFSDLFAKNKEYVIWADWLGDSAAITENDIFTLQIDDDLYEMVGDNDEGEWSYQVFAELEPGTEYRVEFFKNGNSLTNINLRMPYEAMVTFPETFNPAQSANMSWEMDDNNQYQVAFLDSYSYDWDEESHEEIDLSPSAREYTFPANTVANFGPGTEYQMGLIQFNFKNSGRYAFGSSYVAYQYYNSENPAILEASELRNKINKVLSNY